MARHKIRLQQPQKFFINGNWTDPAGPGQVDVIDCATEEVATTVALASSADIANAVQAARNAFDNGPWPRMMPAERAVYLMKIAERCTLRNDEFAGIWSIESGIVHKVAQPRIGMFLHGAFKQAAEMASTFTFIEPVRAASGHQGFRVQEPIGVVALIIPWNGPAGIMANKIAPALLAGCTIVVKSAPEAPCSALLFAEICEDVGLPPGVVNVVTADRDVSAELVANPAIDKITFTGSTASGRKIGAVAAERIARVTLELGGKSPAIVMNDYDVGLAAKTIGTSYFTYLSGQVCHSTTRVIVPRDKHDIMVEGLKAVAESMIVGDPFAPETTIGPLINGRQLANVEHYVEMGLSEGASLATGGRRPPHLTRGYYFEPTVLGHVDNSSVIAQEEIFGPVICVIPADSEDHAIDLANETIYGLNAVVFTNDRERAMTTARRIRSGTVGQNASRTDFSIGFGGWRQSGIGREGGPEGLKSFLESKVVILDEPFAE